ncbi:hypothetical protein PROFUN_00042 [Planoprotostelium fungivorum]|uniref:F-box domain-containing protein n=1 Tax=Planoprotostelium fungivorum TaxID=1890364 RepID=A0A2P6P0H7_9EUKA|nr:hypothetical protein PROFUN_00042 [Planoprotostelium fungivorum]
MNNRKDRRNNDRSVLGIPSELRGNVSVNEQVLLDQNDRKVDALHYMSGSLKQIALDIESGLKEGNTMLDELDGEMSKTQSLLKGAMRHLDRITKQSKGWHMCMLFMFVFFVVFFLLLVAVFNEPSVARSSEWPSNWGTKSVGSTKDNSQDDTENKTPFDIGLTPTERKIALLERLLRTTRQMTTEVQEESESCNLLCDLERELNQLKGSIQSTKLFLRFSETYLSPSNIQSGYFGVIPEEIRMYILSLLSPQDIHSMSRCCKEWCKLVDDDMTWHALCKRDFPSETKPEHRSWKWLYRCHHVQFPQILRSSPGTFVLPDGHKYIGDWKDSLRHGYGVFFWSDGRKYEGEWREDKRNIYGRYTYSDGTSYEGQWKDDKRNGIGTYSWPDGRQYTGEWDNHRKNGQGVHVWPDGSRYTGQWKDGSRNGKGTFHWDNGRYYQGEWQEGKTKGIGAFIWPDGDKYIGEWQAGRRYGKGQLVCTDGCVYNQEWREIRFEKSYKGAYDDLDLARTLENRRQKAIQGSIDITCTHLNHGTTSPTPNKTLNESGREDVSEDTIRPAAEESVRPIESLMTEENMLPTEESLLTGEDIPGEEPPLKRAKKS